MENNAAAVAPVDEAPTQEAPNTQTDAEVLGANPAPPSFTDGMPPEMASAMGKAGLGSITDLANSWMEAQTMIGGSLRVPTKQASPEQWEEFYQQVQSRAPGLQRVDLSLIHI